MKKRKKERIEEKEKKSKKERREKMEKKKIRSSFDSIDTDFFLFRQKIKDIIDVQNSKPEVVFFFFFFFKMEFKNFRYVGIKSRKMF